MYCLLLFVFCVYCNKIVIILYCRLINIKVKLFSNVSYMKCSMFTRLKLFHLSISATKRNRKQSLWKWKYDSNFTLHTMYRRVFRQFIHRRIREGSTVWKINPIIKYKYIILQNIYNITKHKLKSNLCVKIFQIKITSSISTLVYWINLILVPYLIRIYQKLYSMFSVVYTIIKLTYRDKRWFVLEWICKVEVDRPTKPRRICIPRHYCRQYNSYTYIKCINSNLSILAGANNRICKHNRKLSLYLTNFNKGQSNADAVNFSLWIYSFERIVINYSIYWDTNIGSVFLFPCADVSFAALCCSGTKLV